MKLVSAFSRPYKAILGLKVDLSWKPLLAGFTSTGIMAPKKSGNACWLMSWSFVAMPVFRMKTHVAVVVGAST